MNIAVKIVIVFSGEINELAEDCEQEEPEDNELQNFGIENSVQVSNLGFEFGFIMSFYALRGEKGGVTYFWITPCSIAILISFI